MPIVTAILSLITNAPFMINEITSLYNAVKGDMSASDISQIDAALASAQAADAAATAKADVALGDAANRPE